MKRLTLNSLKFAVAVFALTLTVMSIASCGVGGKSVLWYQDSYKAVRCNVDTGSNEYDSFTLRISFDGETAKAEVENPEELSGAVFNKNGDTATLTVGNRTVDLSSYGVGGMERVFHAFSLTEDEISSVSKNDDGDTAVGVLAQGGVYTVVLGNDGLPKEIDFDGVMTVKITEITFYKTADDMPELKEPESSENSESDTESETDGVAESEALDG